MDNAAALTSRPLAGFRVGRVGLVRILIVVGLLGTWQLVHASGLLYRNVIPSLVDIGAELADLLTDPAYYGHLAFTAGEIAVATLIGTLAGFVVGVPLGASRFLSRAFEPYLYYIGPTPKIILFPVMIMWFGVGAGSKVAMGAVSCFFPVALTVAAAIPQIDRTILRVAQSFRATRWQTVVKVYFPAMRYAVLNGVRLGFGLALIGTLLAETKLSNRGVGYLLIQAYNNFDMSAMYAMLIILFVLSVGTNMVFERLALSRHR